MFRMPIAVAEPMSIIGMLEVIKTMECVAHPKITLEHELPVMPPNEVIAHLSFENPKDIKDYIVAVNEVLEEFDFCISIPKKEDNEIDTKGSFILVEIPWECGDDAFWDSVK